MPELVVLAGGNALVTSAGEHAPTLDDTTRGDFVVRVYQHLLGAIVAFAGIEALLLNTGFAEWMYGRLSGGSWLLILGLFMVGQWIVSNAAADLLNRHGVPDENITFIALLAAPEGITRFRQSHPDIPIFLAAIDERLNEHDYIVPGIGDAGDRLYGAE